MKKQWFLLSIGIALSAGMLWASDGPYAEIIPLSSPVYQEMDDLYSIEDLGTPSNSRPWSKSEAQLILSRVNATNLSASARRLYDSLAKAVKPGLRWQFGDGFGFEFRAHLDAEMYTHTNDTDFIKDTDWLYGYEKRHPIVKGQFAFGVKDFFYSLVDYQYGYARTNCKDTVIDLKDYPGWCGLGSLVPEDYETTGERGGIRYVTKSALYATKFLLNIPTSYDADFETPKRAILAFGGKNWNASFSKDRINWGNSHIGNLVIDDHVDYHDFLRFSAFTDHFKFDTVYMFMDCNPTYEERLEDWAGRTDKFERIFMTHRVEFSFSKWATLALTENGMYQAYGGDQLYYMNPVYIFHSLNNRAMFNSIISAELDVMPLRGWNIYGQYVQDQARAANEQDDQAGAWGALGGMEYTHELGNGMISSSLEAAYTTPLLYRRDIVDFLMLTKDYAIGYGHVVHFDYIGFPYGGDAEVLRWDIDYRIPDAFQLKFSATGLYHGEMNMFMSHATSGDNDDKPDYRGTTPSGDTVFESLMLSLYGKYEVPQFVSWVKTSIWSELDWIGRRTYTKATKTYSGECQDLQYTLGVGLEF